MPIRFTCECGQQILSRAEFAGRRVRCNTCQRVLKIPGERPVGGVKTVIRTGPRPQPRPPAPKSASPKSAPPSRAAAAAPRPKSAPPPATAPAARPAPPSEAPSAASAVPASVVRTVSASSALASAVLPSALGNVRFTCACRAEYQAGKSSGGQPAKCTRCGEILFIPTWEAYQRNSYKPLVAARDRPDVYRPRSREGMGGGTVALIVLLTLAVLGGIGYGVSFLI